MLIPKKISGSKKWILAAVILVILIIIVYLIFANFLADKIELGKPISFKVKTLSLSPLTAELKSDFLNQSPYQDLILNGELPVTAEKTGRPNPFEKIPILSVVEEE